MVIEDQEKEQELAEDDAEHVDAALAVFGLVREDPEDLPTAIRPPPLPEFCIWPENWLAFSLWLALQTQWMYAEGQRTGIIHESIWSLLDRHPKVRPRDKWRLFSTITAMESEVLQYLRENRPTV